MIINRNSLRNCYPISNMREDKAKLFGVSSGMSEAGYDITIAEDIHFTPGTPLTWKIWNYTAPTIRRWRKNAEWHDDDIIGNFCLASANEYFLMPRDVVGIVHDKSTWARQGVSVFNTVIEPGWEGFLTLEIVFHGSEPLTISSGQGIAQVVFHQTTDEAAYEGKYQNQGAGPTEAIHEK